MLTFVMHVCIIRMCVGVIPVSYLQRNLGERKLRMRHHYLGGNGTKPMAVALLVGETFINALGE